MVDDNKYSGTLARMAGNIAAGMITNYGGEPTALQLDNVADISVVLAIRILDRVRIRTTKPSEEVK